MRIWDDGSVGARLISASPGYFFANQQKDNAVFFLPIAFGYRSY